MLRATSFAPFRSFSGAIGRWAFFLVCSLTLLAVPIPSFGQPLKVVATVGEPRPYIPFSYISAVWLALGGKEMVIATGARQVVRLDFEESLKVRTFGFKGQSTNVQKPAISRDGKTVTFVDQTQHFDPKLPSQFFVAINTRTGEKERWDAPKAPKSFWHFSGLVQRGKAGFAFDQATPFSLVDTKTGAVRLIEGIEQGEGLGDATMESSDGRFFIGVRNPIDSRQSVEERKKGAMISVVVMDLANGKVIDRRTIPTKQILFARAFADHSGIATGMAVETALTSDGKIGFLGWQGGTVKAFGLAGNKEMRDAIPGAPPMRWTFALSPDDRFLALDADTAGHARRGDLHMYDREKANKLLWTIRDVSMTRMTFSEDGKHLAFFDDYGKTQVHIVESETGRTIYPVKPPKGFQAVASFSEDGKFLKGTVGNKTVQKNWRTSGEASIPSQPLPENPNEKKLHLRTHTVELSADGKFMLYDEDDGVTCRAFIKAVAPNALAKALPVEGKESLVAHFILGGTECLTLTDGKRLDRWDAATLKAKGGWDLSDGVHALRGVTSEGRLALLSRGPARNECTSMEFFDVATGKSLGVVRIEDRVGLPEVRPTPGRAVLQVYGSLNGSGPALLFLDVGSIDTVRRYPMSAGVRINAHAPHDRWYLGLVEEGTKIAMFEKSTGKVRHDLGAFQYVPYSGDPKDRDISPDGRHIAHEEIGDGVGVVRILDTYSPDADYDAKAVWTEDAKRRKWSDLAGTDAKAAFAAIRRLVASPKQAVELVREKLPPAVALDPKVVRNWLDALSSTTLAEREAASKAIDRNRRRLWNVLQKELSNKRDLEAVRRMQAIIRSIPDPTADEILYARVMEALEIIGPNDAGALVDRLAQGADDHPLTFEARFVQRRWQTLRKAGAIE